MVRRRKEKQIIPSLKAYFLSISDVIKTCPSFTSSNKQRFYQKAKPLAISQFISTYCYLCIFIFTARCYAKITKGHVSSMKQTWKSVSPAGRELHHILVHDDETFTSYSRPTWLGRHGPSWWPKLLSMIFLIWIAIFFGILCGF